MAIFYRYINPIYPVSDWLAWPILTIWAWVLFAQFSWLSLGHFFLVRMLQIRELPALETAVLSMAVGIVGFTESMYIAGALGLYGAYCSVGLMVVFIILGARSLHPFISGLLHEYQNGQTWSTTQIVLWSLGVFLTAIIYFGAMTPDAINYDASWSHLTVAQDYARAGRMIPFPADYNKNVPQLASIIHTWGWSVPGLIPPLRWMLALHQEFGIFMWVLAGVAAATRFFLKDERVRGTWVCFYLFPIIFVYDHNLGGAADHIASVFLLPGLLAAGRLGQGVTWQRGILVMICMAGGLLTKYQAIYWVLPLGMYLIMKWFGFVIHTRPTLLISTVRPHPLRWLLPVIWGGTLLILISPHFLKNYIFYNNPTYPFLQDLFTNTRPTVKDAPFLFSHIFTDLNWAPQGTFIDKFHHSIQLIFTFSFRPHYSFTKNVPVFGSLFTLLLPAIFLIRNQRRILLGVYISVAALWLWSMTFNVDRNLQVILPVIVAITAALLIAVIRLGWLARMAVIPLLALQIIWGADAVVYSSYDRLQSSINLIRSGFEGHAKTRFDVYRSSFRALHNAIPLNAKVLLHNQHVNLGIDHELLFDWTGFQGLISYAHIHHSQALLAYYQQLGITHVVYASNGHPTSSLQEEVVFQALVNRYRQLITPVAGYNIFPLPKSSTDHESPYRIALWGIQGYGSGLFAIEQLGTIRHLVPADLRMYASPLAPIPGERFHLQKEKIDAIVAGDRPEWTSIQRDFVNQNFEKVAEYTGEYTVYLKKKT